MHRSKVGRKLSPTTGRDTRESNRTMRKLILGIIALAVVLTSGACGGDASEVPDVVGQRLDVARSDVEDAGYDVEVLGGGLFGVVVEANWYVCEQRPVPGTTGSGSVTLVVDRSCGSATEPGSGEQTPGAGAGAETFVMPDLVGTVLQDAQDRLQSLGSYVLDQEDASGLGRFQVLDSNWIVCRQSPAPGNDVSVDRVVTLWSVKIGERCP